MKRNTAFLVTAASAIICGCQGIVYFIAGALAALGTNDDIELAVGIAFACVGVLFVLIPFGVGIYTWRLFRKRKTEELAADQEPIPPAI